MIPLTILYFRSFNILAFTFEQKQYMLGSGVNTSGAWTNDFLVNSARKTLLL